jgi:hypothetical protein
VFRLEDDRGSIATDQWFRDHIERIEAEARATPPLLDVLGEAIASALFDTPHWKLLDPPYSANATYENRHRFADILARKVAARLATEGEKP